MSSSLPLMTTNNRNPEFLLNVPENETITIGPPKKEDRDYIYQSFTKYGKDEIPEFLDGSPNVMYQRIDQFISNQGIFSCRSSNVYLNTIAKGKNVVGMALYECQTKKKKNQCTLWHMNIQPNYQKQGYGSLMLAHIIKFLRDNKKIDFLALNSTEKGLALYYKAGMLPTDKLEEVRKLQKTAEKCSQFWSNWFGTSPEEKKKHFCFRQGDEFLAEADELPPFDLLLDLKPSLFPPTQCFLDATASDEKDKYQKLLKEQFSIVIPSCDTLKLLKRKGDHEESASPVEKKPKLEKLEKLEDVENQGTGNGENIKGVQPHVSQDLVPNSEFDPDDFLS